MTAIRAGEKRIEVPATIGTEIPLEDRGAAKVQGALRLRVRFALRSGHFAQDDNGRALREHVANAADLCADGF